MTTKTDLEALVDYLIQKIGFKVSDNNFTKNLIHYLNSKRELRSRNLNGGISLVSEDMFKATQNRNDENFQNYYDAIKSEIGKSWNDVTYADLVSSDKESIIASMLNVQAAFDDDQLLPGMAYDEQCTFYLKLIENEPLFGVEEEENCNSKWPTTTRDSFGRDFDDVTNSMKIFVIPLPLLSDEIQNFGIKIKLDPAEGTWVGIGEDCKYSTAYRKANREIMAIYRLEDDEGNFQPPTKKQKMNICLRLEYWDQEEKFNTLNLSGYDFLPEEPSDDWGFKSFRSSLPIGEKESENIKASYERVKDDLMIEDAIKINSNYQISDWGSLKNNDEQIFGENRGVAKMVGGLVAGGFLIILLVIFFLYRCCKRSKNDPMNLPSGTRNSYAAGATKSSEPDPQDTLPRSPDGWMRRSIRNLSKIVQKTPPTQRKLPAGYDGSDFA